MPGPHRLAVATEKPTSSNPHFSQTTTNPSPSGFRRLNTEVTQGKAEEQNTTHPVFSNHASGTFLEAAGAKMEKLPQQRWAALQEKTERAGWTH